MKVIFFCIFFFAAQCAIASEKSYKIRWVLAHEPIDLFKEAAEYFSKKVEAQTSGGVVVEVLTSAEFQKKYNIENKIKMSEVGDLVQSGTVEMSQAYTTDLGFKYNDLWVLDLPFLFNSHEHAQKVLEGEIGKSLLSGLRNSNLEGLAFTYSGGYRIIPGMKKILSVDDFKGLKIRTSNSPVAKETFKVLGANPISMGLREIETALKSKKIDAAESTLPRFFALEQDKTAKIINETYHSLFLTSIIINKNYFSSLPLKYQTIIRDAAFEAARIERDHSINTAQSLINECSSKGVALVKMSPVEEEKFKKAVGPVYAKFSEIFSKDLISNILKLK